MKAFGVAIGVFLFVGGLCTMGYARTEVSGRGEYGYRAWEGWPEYAVLPARQVFAAGGVLAALGAAMGLSSLARQRRPNSYRDQERGQLET